MSFIELIVSNPEFNYTFKIYIVFSSLLLHLGKPKVLWSSSQNDKNIYWWVKIFHFTRLDNLSNMLTIKNGINLFSTFSYGFVKNF